MFTLISRLSINYIYDGNVCFLLQVYKVTHEASVKLCLV